MFVFSENFVIWIEIILCCLILTRVPFQTPKFFLAFALQTHYSVKHLVLTDNVKNPNSAPE